MSPSAGATLRPVKSAFALLPLLVLAQEPVKTSFEVLANFDYQPGMTLPASVTALDGKTVRLQGFMQREVPGSSPVGEFLLVSEGCACNGTPKLNEIVFCAMPDGVTVDVVANVVHVTGKLYVGEEKEDGEVTALYVLDVDEVK